MFSAISAIICIMPLRMQIALADLLAFTLHSIVRYRRKVVRNNLTKSFPEKSESEIAAIEKRFYRNLADIFIEALQLFTMRREALRKRFTIENKALIDQALENGRRVFIAIGHSGNWEWFGVYLSLLYPKITASLYKAQHNKTFDRLIYNMRARLGDGKMFESKSAYRMLVSQKSSSKVVLIIGDQTPGGKPTDHWTTFMHQETPFFTGMEKMAQSLDFSVFFAHSTRTSRGHYKVVVEELEPADQAQGGYPITEAYARRLEQALIKTPDNWLWSHRRWKHKRIKAGA